MSKKYLADLDVTFDDSTNDDNLSDYGTDADEALYNLFNESDKRGKGKIGRRKPDAKAELSHRSLPHGWEDFDYGNEPNYDVDDT